MACRLKRSRPCVSRCGSLPARAHSRTSFSGTISSVATSVALSSMVRFDFTEILQQPVNERERMRRTAGDVEINSVFLDKLTRQLIGALENAAADRARAEKNQQLR